MATPSVQLIHFSCVPTPTVEAAAQTLIHSEVIQKILNQTPTSPTQLTVTKEEINLGSGRTLKLSDLPTTSKKAHKLLDAAEKVDSLSFTVIGEISPSETPCSPGKFNTIFFEDDNTAFGIEVLSFLPLEEMAKFRKVSKSAQRFLNENINQYFLGAGLVLLNQFASSTLVKTRISFLKDISPYELSLQKLTGVNILILEWLARCNREIVTDLDLTGLSVDNEQLDEILETLPNLKTIKLTEWANSSDLDYMNFYNRICIDTNSPYKIIEISKFRQVRQHVLTLNRCNPATLVKSKISFLKDILPYQQSLNELTGKSISISQWLERCKREMVWSLDLRGSNVDDAQLAEIIEMLPGLRDINLNNCWNITNAGLSHLQNCTTVRLFNNPNITDAGLNYLKKCMFIDLGYCYGITGNGLGSLENCWEVDLMNSKITDTEAVLLKGRTCVKLNECRHITDVALSHLRNAAFVEVSFCPNITDAGIDFLKRCKEIKVIGCQHITQEKIASLRERGVTVITEEALGDIEDTETVITEEALGDIEDTEMVPLVNLPPLYDY